MIKIAYEQYFLNVFPRTETKNFTIDLLVFLVAKIASQELSNGFLGFPGFQSSNLANTLHQDKQARVLKTKKTKKTIGKAWSAF